jgi:predicted amidohydrolase YtcJ
VPEEKITLEEALTAYTWGSAYSGFVEQKVGRLEPGKYADLAVLSQDLFRVEPVEIPSVEVEMTLVGGDIVYRNEG